MGSVSGCVTVGSPKNPVVDKKSIPAVLGCHLPCIRVSSLPAVLLRYLPDPSYRQKVFIPPVLLRDRSEASRRQRFSFPLYY